MKEEGNREKREYPSWFYWFIVSFQVLIVLGGLPILARALDVVSNFTLKQSLPFVYRLVFLCCIFLIILCIFLLFVSWLKTHYRRPRRWALVAVSVVTASLVGSLVLFPQILRGTYKDRAPTVLTTGKVSFLVNYLISSEKEVSSMNYDAISSSRIPWIAQRKRIFPGNVYRLDLRQRIGETILATGVLQRAFFEGRKWEWLDVDSIKLNSDSVRDFQRLLLLRLEKALDIKFDENNMKNAISRYTKNKKAYDYYLRGLEKYGLYTRSDNDSAIFLFRVSIREDPTFSLSYAALADCYNQMYQKLWNGKFEVIKEGAHYANVADSLGNSLMAISKAKGLTYQNLGLYFERKWASSTKKDSTLLDSAYTNLTLAIKNYKKAINAAPNCPVPRNNIAVVYMQLAAVDTSNARSWLDKMEETLKEALDIAPFYPPLYINYGVLLFRKHTSQGELLTNTSVNEAISYLREGIACSGIQESFKAFAYYNMSCILSKFTEKTPNQQVYDMALVYLDSCLILNRETFCALVTGNSDLNVKPDADLAALRIHQTHKLKEILGTHGCDTTDFKLSNPITFLDKEIDSKMGTKCQPIQTLFPIFNN